MWPIDKRNRPTAVGNLIEVTGKFCAPWLRGEDGIHNLTHKGREESVLIESSSAPRVSDDSHHPFVPPAYQPPADVHRRGALQHPVQVRHWNLDDEICLDPVAGKLAVQPEALRLVLEKRVFRRASEAALLP